MGEKGEGGGKKEKENENENEENEKKKWERRWSKKEIIKMRISVRRIDRMIKKRMRNMKRKKLNYSNIIWKKMWKRRKRKKWKEVKEREKKRKLWRSEEK